MPPLRPRARGFVNRLRDAFGVWRPRHRTAVPKPRFRPRVEPLEDLVLPAISVYRADQLFHMNQYAGNFYLNNLQRLAGMELAVATEGAYALGIPDNAFSPLVGPTSSDGTSISFSYQNSFVTFGGVTAFALDARIVASSNGTLFMGMNYRSGNNLAAVINGVGFGSSVSNAFEAIVSLRLTSGSGINLTPSGSSNPNPIPAGFRPPASGSQEPAEDVSGLISSRVIRPKGRQAAIQRTRRAKVQLTNDGTFTLPTVRLVLTGLRKGIKLRGAAGTTSGGEPFVILTDVRPGETREVALSFKNKTGKPVRFQPVFLA